MATYRKRKRKLRFEALAGLFFIFASIIAICSNLFISSMHASLMIDIQKMNIESETLRTENKKLSIEIQTLQNKDRVFTIAQDAGLEQNQDNVVSVAMGE